MVDDAQGRLVHIAVHMDHGLGEVQQLLLVDVPVHAGEVARRCARHGVLDEGRLHEVDLRLRIPADVHEAVAAGAALDGVERVEDVGEFPVVVEPRRRHVGPVLCGEEHMVPDVLAVVQHRPVPGPLPVVDVDDRRLVRGVHGVVVEELRGEERTAV